MPEQVTFPKQERWLSSRGLMAFPAHIDRRTWTCLLSEEALNELFDAGRIGRFDAFSQNRGEIESVTATKILTGLFPPGEIRIGRDDFRTAQEFIAWE